MSNTLENIINTVTANGMREITVERAKQIAIEYAKIIADSALNIASEKVKYDYSDIDIIQETITDKSNIVIR